MTTNSEKSAQLSSEGPEYYLVKVEGGGAATVIHTNHQGAADRARALAIETHRPVLVFRAVERYRATLPPAAEIPIEVEVL